MPHDIEADAGREVTIEWDWAKGEQGGVHNKLEYDVEF